MNEIHFVNTDWSENDGMTIVAPGLQRTVSAFALSSEQQEILDIASAFAREHFWPLQARMDNEEWWPEQAIPQLGAMGFLGVTVDPELGGAGSDFFTSALITQGIARWNHSLALSYIAHENLCLANIARNGSATLKARYLPGLCDGSRVGALGLTEPGAGSDALGAMATTARHVGAGRYLLNGRKMYITNGPIADVILVYAKTDKAAGTKGISAFVVEKGFKGFVVAQKLDKMGFRGSTTAELVFDDCEVPAENLLGEENLGVGIVMSGLDFERVIVSMINLGMAERALDLAVDYARNRQQFGRPIGDFQLIQGKLADMYVGVETMRALCYGACAEANAAIEGGRGHFHKLSAAAILHSAEACSRIVADALQIFGGSGYMRETEINRLYRASKLLEIGAGTSEIRRTIIAGELLR